ncbi:MAG: WG repeat-containing protein [Azoarcus sp.]|nr:WG repeat-containing protein [Azoarcus sp.]
MFFRLLSLLVMVFSVAFVAQFQSPPWTKTRERDAVSDCERMRQCVRAAYAWPSGLQGCPAVLRSAAFKYRGTNGKWGYNVAEGACIEAQLVAPRFEAVGDFGDNGLAKVKFNGKWGYIDLKGSETIPLLFDEIGDFDSDLLPVKAHGKWGYLDATARTIVPPSFQAVSGVWRDGLSAVRVDDKWGYVDLGGDLAIAPRFDQAGEFRNGLARVAAGRRWGVIDTQGEVVIPLNFDTIFTTGDPGLFMVSHRRRFGYFDSLGNEIIPARLSRPLKTKRDDNGLIQIYFDASLTRPIHANPGDPAIPVDGWFYLDAEKEKMRFDENGKALLWRGDDWFHITPEGGLVKYDGETRS